MHKGDISPQGHDVIILSADITTVWGGYLPLLSRNGITMMAALRLLEELMPFSLRGIAVDNVSALMNAPLEAWCERP